MYILPFPMRRMIGIVRKSYVSVRSMWILEQRPGRSHHGAPDTVEYIWNGANQYVFDWLEENFGALSKCPIAVQKYASDDDWKSHIYILNREKFLKYFGVESL